MIPMGSWQRWKAWEREWTLHPCRYCDTHADVFVYILPVDGRCLMAVHRNRDRLRRVVGGSSFGWLSATDRSET
jgi:hypothetical protein